MGQQLFYADNPDEEDAQEVCFVSVLDANGQTRTIIRLALELPLDTVECHVVGVGETQSPNKVHYPHQGHAR